MVREMISKLKGEGGTIVVCTHNLDEAQRLADIVGIINQRLLVCDTLTNLRSGGSMTTPIEIELRGPLRDHQPLATKLPFVKSFEGKDGKYLFEVGNAAINTPIDNKHERRSSRLRDRRVVGAVSTKAEPEKFSAGRNSNEVEVNPPTGN